MIKKMTNIFLKILYPPVCPFCRQVTDKEICDKCRGKLVYISEPRCKLCGKPIFCNEKEYCFDCNHTKHQFDRGFSLWKHEGIVLDSIYQFKYHNRRIFAQFYAYKLWEKYHLILEQWAVKIIIPIPLHKKRKKERGYNQSELVAKELGDILNVPVKSDVLTRNKNTKRQKVLGVDKRRRNLENAFVLDASFRSVSSVLIIDDIYTTGSTIDAAARVLKRAGVQNVYFLTISIGQGY